MIAKHPADATGDRLRQLQSFVFADVLQNYGPRDVQYFALASGLGLDPADSGQLGFVYEDCEAGLRVLPTFATLLAGPGFWIQDPRSGLDWRRVLNAEQGFSLDRPLPATAAVIGRTRIVSVHDRGAEKGLFLCLERVLTNAEDGAIIGRVTRTLFCGGDGGIGGQQTAPPRPPAVPSRTPDFICDLPTSPQSALIFRLSGDPNPLHADPALARSLGYDRPILHGLCTMSVACHAILKVAADYDPRRMKAMNVRFTKPVYPGETIRTPRFVRDGDDALMVMLLLDGHAHQTQFEDRHDEQWRATDNGIERQQQRSNDAAQRGR